MNKDPHHDMALDPGDEQNVPALEVSDLRRSLRSLMKPAITVDIDTPVRDAVHLMQTKRIGCVLVTSHRKLLGIFTERDVLKKILGSAFDLRSTPISEVMTINPQALNESDTIAYALNFMDLGGYRHIPIVNELFEPLGLVSVKDIVSYLVQHFADEVLNLPPHPLSISSEEEVLPEDGLAEEGGDADSRHPEGEEIEGE
ncbi:MAG: CBS domain-containing protein [Bacteroidetes bacterium]|nr:CBS domain-containing protein [Bacteroidota bacterium]